MSSPPPPPATGAAPKLVPADPGRARLFAGLVLALLGSTFLLISLIGMAIAVVIGTQEGFDDVGVRIVLAVWASFLFVSIGCAGSGFFLAMKYRPR